MKPLIFFIVLLPITALADDYCFVNKAPKQIAILNKPTVINRIVALQPQKEEEIDAEGIIAEGKALEMALQAIPGIEKDLEAPQWKQFRFQNNMPTYVAKAVVRQQVKSRLVTKNYYGAVDISFRIKPDGIVDFNNH